MQIIGAGFGRTGTLSLKHALETLGFGPCYHMIEVFQNPSHISLWHDIAQGKPADWKEIFQGYQATVDWPACEFYKELMEVYPDAKVLLSIRDPERWYESVRETIYQLNGTLPFWARWFLPKFFRLGEMTDALIWKGRFLGRFEDKAYALSVFNQHIEEVKRVVPPERLLVFDVREGWEPLCRFLGVPVPEGKEFPRLNDKAEMQRRMRQFKLTTRLAPLAAGGLLALAYWLLRPRRPSTNGL